MKRMTLETVTDCNDCGACCSEMRSPPFTGILFDGDWDVPSSIKIVLSGDKDYYGDFARVMAAPEAARRTFIEGVLSNRANETPCSWFDAETKKCRWYAWRPDVCRNSLEVGDEGCLRWRHKVGISKARKWRMRNGKLVSA